MCSTWASTQAICKDQRDEITSTNHNAHHATLAIKLLEKEARGALIEEGERLVRSDQVIKHLMLHRQPITTQDTGHLS
jgi:hypothetical protein